MTLATTPLTRTMRRAARSLLPRLACLLVATTAPSYAGTAAGPAFGQRLQSIKGAMPDKASRPTGLAVTVLGSGGPMAMTNRASAGYVVYLDRIPRLLVDGGGGTFERLGEARIFDLVRMDTWLFTHLHIDHSAEFPAIIKSMYFLRRGYNVRTPLTIVGPDAWGDFPSTTQFVDAFFNPEHGIYRYLHQFLKTVYAGDLQFGTRDLPYDYQQVRTAQTVMTRDGATISYIPVMHGPRSARTPAVAYRIDYKGHSVTFSGDLNSKTGNLVKLARGSDILIYDAALGPAQNFDPPDLYHTPPTDIGRAAQQAGVGTLVLSHFMPPYVPVKIKRIVAAVKKEFHGTVIVAEDMMMLSASGAGNQSHAAANSPPQGRIGPMQRFRERIRQP